MLCRRSAQERAVKPCRPIGSDTACAHTHALSFQTLYVHRASSSGSVVSSGLLPTSSLIKFTAVPMLRGNDASPMFFRSRTVTVASQFGSTARGIGIRVAISLPPSGSRAPVMAVNTTTQHACQSARKQRPAVDTPHGLLLGGTKRAAGNLKHIV